MEAGEVIGFEFGGSHFTGAPQRLRGLLEILGTFVATGEPLADMAAASSTAARFVVSGAEGVARSQSRESLVTRDAALAFARVDDATPAVTVSSMGETALAGNLFTWAELTGFHASGAESDGTYQGSGIQVGADMAIGSDMVLGLSFGAERIDTSTSVASLDGSLVFVQPYLAFRSGALSGEATLLYGEGEYDQSGFARDGEGETRLRAMTLGAGYDLPLAAGVLTPNFSLSVGEEEITGTGGALASLGTESVDFGRMTLGTRYRESVGGQGSVFVGLYGDYAETTAETTLVSELLADDGWSARVEFGSSAEFASGLGLDTSFEIGGIGGDLRQISGGLKATLRF